jgi:argininosuccinate lyase
MLQTLTDDAQMTQRAIHIHEAYNSSLRDHKIIHEKENLSDIEKTLHMLRESILVEDFNLHHFT